MALSNLVVAADVTSLFRSYAQEGLTTDIVTDYIANAFTFIGNLLKSDLGVDPDDVDSDHSGRFNLCIVYKALELIFEDLRPATDEAPRYKERQDDYEMRFREAWENLQFGTDTDGDGEADTTVSNTTTLNVSRG